MKKVDRLLLKTMAVLIARRRRYPAARLRLPCTLTLIQTGWTFRHRYDGGAKT